MFEEISTRKLLHAYKELRKEFLSMYPDKINNEDMRKDEIDKWVEMNDMMGLFRTELSTRENIPNKKESKELRKQKKKEGN